MPLLPSVSFAIICNSRNLSSRIAVVRALSGKQCISIFVEALGRLELNCKAKLPQLSNDAFLDITIDQIVSKAQLKELKTILKTWEEIDNNADMINTYL